MLGTPVEELGILVCYLNVGTSAKQFQVNGGETSLRINKVGCPEKRKINDSDKLIATTGEDSRVDTPR